MATNGQPTPPPSDQPITITSPPTADPDVPRTSAHDDGTTKRPRDARLIHAVLSHYGITTYQERVPLQLLDFAYRYTSGILSDALRLSSEGYTNAPSTTLGTGGGRGRAAAVDDGERIGVTSLRQAIAARQGYTFQGPLPKEFLLCQALERNRIALPPVAQSFGVQLPPEKYCLTGVGWKVKEEWEDEVEDEEEDEDEGKRLGKPRSALQASDGERRVSPERSGGADDEAMGGMEAGDDDDAEGAGRMEDVFGEEGGGDEEPMEQD